MSESRLVIDVKNMPEVLWEMRHAIASALRHEAEGEGDSRVARRLIEIAAQFESGIDEPI
jgi:hypothetical protein